MAYILIGYIVGFLYKICGVNIFFESVFILTFLSFLSYAFKVNMFNIKPIVNDLIFSYINFFKFNMINIFKVLLISAFSFIMISIFLESLENIYSKDYNLQREKYSNTVYSFVKRDNAKPPSSLNNKANIIFKDKSLANNYKKDVLKNLYKVEKKELTGDGKYLVYLVDKVEGEHINTYSAILLNSNNSKVSYSYKLFFKKVMVKFYSKKSYELKSSYLVKGRLEKFSKARNYKGFDSRNFNYGRDMYFNVVSHNDHIKKVSLNYLDFRLMYENLVINLKTSFINRVSSSSQEGLLLGIVLGDVSKISEEDRDKYKEVNVYHLLAVSGSHATYILVIAGVLSKIFRFGKIIRITIISFSMIIFMSIVGLSSSIFRVGNIVLLRNIYDLINKKSSYFMLIIISYFTIVIYNPYKILDIGMYLSYGGMFAIISINNILSNNYIFERLAIKLKLLTRLEFKESVKKVDMQIMDSYFGSSGSEAAELGDFYSSKIKDFKVKFRVFILNIFKALYDIVVTTLSVQILIWPILAVFFSTINFNFLISNIFAIPIIGYATILGFIVLFFEPVFPFLGIIYNFLIIISTKLISLADYLISLSRKLGGNTYISDLGIGFLFIYSYIMYFSINIITNLSNHGILKHSLTLKNVIQKSISVFGITKTVITIRKFFILIIILCTYTVFTLMDFREHSSIYFADVGQGDASLIKTKEGKNVVIDTGEGMGIRYPEGEKTFFPYLLKRKVSKIDYLIISHFDSDHSGGAYKILKNLKVKNLVISSRYTVNKNFKKIISLAYKKNVNIIKVKRGDKLNVSDSLKLKVLWPGDKKIKEKEMNNNAIVLLAEFGNYFKVLYTGDVELQAEKEIFNNVNNINVNVLKVPHHGSITSSSKYMLDAVSGKDAVISVSKKNSFGHPSSIVIDRLKEDGFKNIRRTDNDGEIEYILGD